MEIRCSTLAPVGTDGRRGMMKIWHYGPSPTGERVSGIQNTGRLLVREQRRRGHAVVVLSSNPAGADGGVAETADRPRQEYIPRHALKIPNRIRELLDREPPDVVHFHSVFVPGHIPIARELRRRNIPYVVKLGGGLDPRMLRRGKQWVKTVYTPFLQRPLLRGAAAVVFVTAGEENDFKKYIGHFGGCTTLIPNPVDADSLTDSWRGPREGGDVVFLGRFDPVHKGLDRLAEYSKHMKSIQVRCYGLPDRNTDVFAEVLEKAPENIRFVDPVFGSEKNRILSEAAAYVHPARWEQFGISIAEALWVGVPCVISDSIEMARLFRDHDLGEFVDSDIQNSAKTIQNLLADPNRQRELSTRGRAFARANFAPERIVDQYEELYQNVAETAQAGSAARSSLTESRS